MSPKLRKPTAEERRKFSRGIKGEQGEPGKPGESIKGDPGKDAPCILSHEIDEENRLRFALEDGTFTDWVQLHIRQPENGKPGPKGDSIKGDKGDPGEPGKKGDTGNYIEAIETKGKSIRLVTSDGITSPWAELDIKDGEKGDKGDKGDKGESIKGDKGDPGKDAPAIVRVDQSGSSFYLVLDNDQRIGPVRLPPPIIGGGAGISSSKKLANEINSRPNRSVSSDYQATSNDFTILVTAVGGDVTITLPEPSSVRGQIYNIKSKWGNDSKVKILPTIDGDSSGFELRLSSEVVNVQSVETSKGFFEYVVYA